MLICSVTLIPRHRGEGVTGEIGFVLYSVYCLPWPAVVRHGRTKEAVFYCLII